MAMQALGTRAVGEGAARASGACGLNKLVPMIRHLVLCSTAVPLISSLPFFSTPPEAWVVPQP